jgi:quinol monooxygenase YgiN
MAQLLVHHKVQDYAAWRKVYDELGRTRAQFGSTGDRVYRTANDPNEVVIISEWPDVERARAYAQSPDLKEGMQRAGVISQPEVLFLEEA